MVRVFVRLGATERVMTLDLPPATPVTELKRAIIESRQSDVSTFELMLHSHVLPGAARLEECATSEQGRALHVALIAQRRDVQQLHTTELQPPAGMTGVGIDGIVGCTLPASVQTIAEPALALELRGWMDQPCSGAVTFDAVRRRISFAAREPLAPGKTHVVIVRGSALSPPHEDAVWQFGTAAATPVRVLLELLDQPGRRLVTLQRSSPGMISELTSSARSCFPDAGPAFAFAVANEELDGHAVSRLQEGDVVLCIPGPGDADGPVIHEEVPLLTHEEYCREHWVNREAGYFAVCGKLSAAEEHAALMAVVQAFEDGEAESALPRASTATRRRDGPQPEDDSSYEVPLGQIEVRWGTPREPPCFDIARALAGGTELDGLLDFWRARSYAVVRLPPEVYATIERVYDAWTTFCALPLQPKQQQAAGGDAERYLGYHHRPHFHKELFQLRGCARAAGAWPLHAEGQQLRAAAEAAFDALAGLGGAVFCAACERLGVASSEAARGMLEPPFAAQAESSSLSQSNLSLFRYSAALGEPERPGVARSVHCPYHSDIGLVTLIPRARGAAGLHVYDFAPECVGWTHAEEGMPPDAALLFGGESLHRHTAGALLPGIHQVAHVEGERLSCPFQLLARADATLGHGDDAVGAQEFVERVSASRVSSNFPRQ